MFLPFLVLVRLAFRLRFSFFVTVFLFVRIFVFVLFFGRKGHQFMGEESTFDSRGATGDAFEASPTWVIDPLDGTTNFVHGYPLFCVSIALVVER